MTRSAGLNAVSYAGQDITCEMSLIDSLANEPAVAHRWVYSKLVDVLKLSENVSATKTRLLPTAAATGEAGRTVTAERSRYSTLRSRPRCRADLRDWGALVGIA